MIITLFGTVTTLPPCTIARLDEHLSLPGLHAIIILCFCRHYFRVWPSATGILGDVSCYCSQLGNSLSISLSEDENREKAEILSHFNCPAGLVPSNLAFINSSQ